MNIWQCNKCSGDWMKGKFGTRMVQVITRTWLLQLVLDDPPQDLENKWQKDRIAYYAKCPTCASLDRQEFERVQREAEEAELAPGLV